MTAPLPHPALGEYSTESRPTVAFVDLVALADNFKCLDDLIGTGREVLAVVKAEAYGHGAPEAAAAFVGAGARWLAVATVEEGEALIGGSAPGLLDEVRVLVMSGSLPQLASRIASGGFEAVVWDMAQAEALAAAATSAGRLARVHVKIDSGMHRLGIPPGEAPDFFRRLGDMAGVEATGLMSHLAQADEEGGGEPTREQFAIVRALMSELEADGLLPPTIHTANSAGGISYPDAPGTLVRCGIALYGCPPQGEGGAPLRAALTLKSALIQIKDVPAGEAIGYGGTWRMKKPGRIAVVPVGYADGYPRILSSRADVLVRGQRVPIAGRVSMDMITVDVSEIEDAVVGDEVILIGTQGDETIPCEALATLSHTITYEILSRLGHRVPRVFFEAGGVAGHRIIGGGVV
ncbi:MAG: alanine racemase [Nitrospinaceae bacterium]|nr:alanine racemase [Nitrospinaceae bacterium]